MKEKTFFGNAVYAKPGRKFAAYVLDFLLALIVSLFLFGGEELIFNATSLVKDTSASLQKTVDEMYETVEESGIDKRQADGTLYAQDDLVRNYVYGAVKESLIRNGKETLSSLYDRYDAIREDNDSCYGYYVTFKPSHKEAFMGSSASEKSGLSYYLTELKKEGLEDFFEGEEYPYLNLDTANKIDAYFRDTSYQLGKERFDSLSSRYLSLLQEGIRDLQGYYKPYLSLHQEYENQSRKIYRIKTIELLISYLLSMFIIYLLFPLVFRDRQTLSQKILHLGVATKEGYSLPIGYLFLKWAINLFEYPVLISVTGFVFFGTSAIEMLGTGIFGSVSLLSLSLFSVLLLLVGFLFCFLFKDTHQSLSEWISKETIRDANVFETKKTQTRTLNDGR